MAYEFGERVFSKVKEAFRGFGVESSVLDPARVVDELRQRLSSGVARHLADTEWFFEFWQDHETGKEYVLARVLTQISDSDLKTDAETALEEQVQALHQKALEAEEEAAKRQMEAASEAIKKLKEEGSW